MNNTMPGSVEVYKDQAVDLIFSGLVVDSEWIPFYTVPNGNALELSELFVYNDTGGAVTIALWIGPSSVTPSAGLSQEYVPFVRSVAAGVSMDWAMRTGIPGGWQIYGYSTAGAADVLNFHLSGRQVTF